MYYAFSTSTDYKFQCEYIKDVFCITHVHGYFELIFVLDGELTIQSETGDFNVEAGKTAIVMPYEVHGFKTPIESEILVMEFPVEYICEYKKIFEGKTFKDSAVPMSDTLRMMIIDLLTDKRTDEFSKRAVVYRTISEFMKKTELTESENVARDIFTRAVIYISEHFAEEMSQKKVAEEIGVSTVHLSRVLSKQRNFGFVEIVNSARMREAKRLMEETNMSVADVSFSVGFGSIRSFNRLCKKYFNCTPLDLRNSEKVEFVRKKEAALI